MKIYEIGTGYTPIPARMGAATEIVVEELTKAFLKMGLPAQIIDIASQNRGEHRLPIREVRVPACFSGTDVKLGLMHKGKRVIYSLCLTKALHKLLKEEQETVVLHFHNQYNLFFFLKLTSKKLRRRAILAYTNHSGIWRQDWSRIESTIRKRYFQEAECMRSADVVFVLNSETKANAVTYTGAPEDRLVLIGNGVNTDIYHPLPPEEKQAAREKWGFRNGPVILQVGSVNENKGQLRTAQYLLPLLKKYPDLVFAYAGGIVEETYYRQILQLARDNGLEKQIRYLGMVSPGRALNELYNCAAATILPSRLEAFGLVAVESMACGVPVLVDRNGMVQFDGGIIPYEESTVADAVEKILFGNGCDMAQVSGRARQFVTRCYSWDSIAADYLSEFSNRMRENG